MLPRQKPDQPNAKPVLPEGSEEIGGLSVPTVRNVHVANFDIGFLFQFLYNAFIENISAYGVGTGVVVSPDINNTAFVNMTVIGFVRAGLNILYSKWNVFRGGFISDARPREETRSGASPIETRAIGLKLGVANTSSPFLGADKSNGITIDGFKFVQNGSSGFANPAFYSAESDYFVVRNSSFEGANQCLIVPEQSYALRPKLENVLLRGSASAAGYDLSPLLGQKLNSWESEQFSLRHVVTKLGADVTEVLRKDGTVVWRTRVLPLVDKRSDEERESIIVGSCRSVP